MAYEMTAGAIGQAVGSAIQNFGNYSAQAAARANGVSAAAQAAQGAFNQGSANIANQIGTDRIAEQYAYNTAQAAMANQFTSDMWDRSSAWNEAMWEKAAAWNEMMWQKNADWNEAMMNKQMEYNTAEALKARNWQKKMAETVYQRATTDMEKAGLNPILAVTGGGISTGTGTGSAASIGGTSMGSSNMGAPSMSGATGQMASGGLMNGIAANESSYSGQMEYMGGMLGLLSAAIGGISTAFQAFGTMGDVGKGIGEGIADIINSMKDANTDGKTLGIDTTKSPNEVYGKGNYMYTNKGFWNHKNNQAY